ncbi:hypothetical protein VP01_4890g2 [Puccinia sorghi]|uniref:Uncharacterized protein n=1 Tax=Puccinia sorghi TaxID=27349 RepID=A0A0L6UM65_9BASI|nr:hypothetical protein VP01_4890g2 [Puccinia sorghi]
MISDETRTAPTIQSNPNSLKMKPAYMIKQSLVGKDFKIILQVAPFLFFKFMSPDQQNHWMALCMLSTYFFTTKMDNMTTSLSNIYKYIRIFLHHTIRMSTRCANKPKFHMLLHLPESIKRFGPPSLFATPGQDIAISFGKFQSLQLILSGAKLTNNCSGLRFHPGPNVTQLFLENEMIQQSMGYNSSMVKTEASYPIQMQSPLPNDEKEAVPHYLIQTYPGYEFKQIHQLRINVKDVVPTGNEAVRFIGQVEYIWKGKAQNQSCLYIKLTLFNVGPLHNFYNMNFLVNQNEVGMCRAVEIVACLNVQHDCFSANCSFINNPAPHNNSQEGNPPRTIIQHKDDKTYILNAASLSSISWRQNSSSLTHPPIASAQWKQVVQHEMKKW